MRTYCRLQEVFIEAWGQTKYAKHIDAHAVPHNCDHAVHTQLKSICTLRLALQLLSPGHKAHDITDAYQKRAIT